MKILAIDFSSSQRSVAALNGGSLCEALEANMRATNVIELIREALQGASLVREEVECLALGTGPGSYTGVRASIAMAQGWQLARGIRLLGISSAEAIAAQGQAEGLRGLANVVIDAQRGEFYLGTYDLNPGTPAEIVPLKIVSLDEICRRELNGERLIGPEVTRWFPKGQIVFPRAATLARLAANRTDFISGEKLEPIYLRETNFVKAPPARVISTQ
jgi:tRNA threonylcarbamoyl adenosine modification protein YeaZ